MPVATSTTLQNANDASAIVLQVNSAYGPDCQGRYSLSGAYTGASVIAEKCYTAAEYAANSWTTLAGVVRLDTFAAASGTITLADGTSNEFWLPAIAGLYAVRFRLVGISTGSITADGVTSPGTGSPVITLPVAVGVASTPQTITSTSTTAFAVGANGSTNPAFDIDASTGSSATGVKVKSAAAAGGAALSVISSGTNEALTVDAKGSGTITLAGTSTGNVVVGNSKLTVAPSSGNLASAGSILSSGTAGVGYTTGAGGAVTQATSRTTGVTINKLCGAITLVSAAGSTTPFTFTVTNSTVAATDTVDVCQASGTDKYQVFVTAVGAGSFAVTAFTTGGTTTEQPVFNFTVTKGVTS